MQLCESVLMALIAVVGLYATYTDITRGIIENKALLLASSVGIVVNVVYLGLYAREHMISYFINLVIVSAFAIALYGIHVWAAGDCKFIICVTLLFPARLYDVGGSAFAPGIVIYLYIFLIAYVYIIIDSAICFFRRDSFYHRRIVFGDVKRFLQGYLICLIYIRALGELLRFALKVNYYDNQVLFSLLFFLVAIIIQGSSLFKKWYLVGAAILINIIFLPTFQFHTSNLYGYIVLLLALLLRVLLSGYNYSRISTETVKKGMVLSAACVMEFSASRIKGLPTVSFEDMRSRLSEGEADAVRRWGKSKQGKESVMIVKKIPFAIFIFMGELVFFFTRIWG